MGSVLIVDDNPDLCLALAKVVERLGHEAATSPGGVEALARIRERRPDVVILDVMMPGLDGLEVLRRVRTDPETADLPVVVFSAVADPAFAEHAVKQGANEFWLKATFDYAKLSHRLHRYMPREGPNPPRPASAGH